GGGGGGGRLGGGAGGEAGEEHAGLTVGRADVVWHCAEAGAGGAEVAYRRRRRGFLERERGAVGDRDRDVGDESGHRGAAGRVDELGFVRRAVVVTGRPGDGVLEPAA